MKLAWVTYLGALSRINAILIPRISAHPPILAQRRVHRPWALFREGTVYIYISFAQFIPVYVGLAQARPNYVKFTVLSHHFLACFSLCISFLEFSSMAFWQLDQAFSQVFTCLQLKVIKHDLLDPLDPIRG